ncbi:MAG: hypothetical protein ACRC33_24015 [Gemmataceae bacterium]
MILAALLFAADFTLEAEKDAAPPEDVSAAVAKLLERRCLRVKDAKGDAVAEVWLRAAVPVEATDEQIANGLTYAEVPATTLVGVIRLPGGMTDYRKQKVPAGVYTLRLAVQPPTGDHMGTAPHGEFALLSAASDDRKAGLMEVKGLVEMSTKVNESHPSVMVLLPGDKDAGAEPRLVDKGKGHRVLFARLGAVSAKGSRAVLPFGLTVVGGSAAR